MPSSRKHPACRKECHDYARSVSAQVSEDARPGTAVGQIRVEGGHEGAAFSYHLLHDAGGRFKIDGTQLVVGSDQLSKTSR